MATRTVPHGNTGKKKTAKKAGKKASKKLAKKSPTKKAAGKNSKPAKSKQGKVIEPFPLEVCQRLVDLVTDKAAQRSRLSDLKRDRKDLRGQVADHNTEKDAIIDAEKAEGRGVDAGFAPEASRRLLSLQDDINRWTKQIADLDDKIRDAQDHIRDAQSETDKTIAEQDPTGTLFEALAAATAAHGTAGTAGEDGDDDSENGEGSEE